MAPKETSPTDYAAEREKERAEYIDLADWYTDVCDDAILSATQDFTSSAKAASFARQTAKNADPAKFARLRVLEMKYTRYEL